MKEKIQEFEAEVDLDTTSGLNEILQNLSKTIVEPHNKKEIIINGLVSVLEQAYFRDLQVAYDRFTSYDASLIPLQEERTNILELMRATENVDDEVITEVSLNIVVKLLEAGMRIDQDDETQRQLETVADFMDTLPISYSDDDRFDDILAYYTADASINLFKDYTLYTRQFDLDEQIVSASPAILSICDRFDIRTYTELRSFIEENSSLSIVARLTPQIPLEITPADLELRQKGQIPLPLHFIEIAKREGLDVQNLNEDDYKKIYKALETYSDNDVIGPEWKTTGILGS